MKKALKLLAIIALVTVIGFSMAACGGGGDDDDDGDNTATYTGTSGGTTYTLKITKAPARYTAQQGDDYELTGAKKSIGKVDSVFGNVLTLKPSNAATTFTATVTGTSLTSLDDTITWTDNTTAAGPGALTGGTNPGTDPGTGSGGTLTVTDIPAKYNGKYAMFTGTGKNLAEETFVIQGYQRDSAGNITYSRISNGKVSMPTWLVNPDVQTWVKYSGNDTVSLGTVTIYQFGSPTENNKSQSNVLVSSAFMSSIIFSNGSATISKNDATSWKEDPFK